MLMVRHAEVRECGVTYGLLLGRFGRIGRRACDNIRVGDDTREHGRFLFI
jgi:hypothetical protein